MFYNYLYTFFICKNKLEAHPDLLSELDMNFKELYPYFD